MQSDSTLDRLHDLTKQLKPLSPLGVSILRAADAAGLALASHIHRMSGDDLAIIASNSETLHAIALAALSAMETTSETQYLAARELHTFQVLSKLITAARGSKHLQNLAQKTGAATVPLVLPYLYGELVDEVGLIAEALSFPLSWQLDKAG